MQALKRLKTLQESKELEVEEDRIVLKGAQNGCSNI